MPRRHDSAAREHGAQSEILLRQVVEIFDERHYRAIESLYFRVRRFDDVIFVRRMCAGAVTEPEMSGRELERFAGKDISWIRAGVAWPQQRIDSEFLVRRGLRGYERGIGGCARWIVTARHVHFNVPEAALG